MAYNIYVLDPAVWRFELAGYNNGTRLTVRQWGQQLEADLCFNLTTFNMANGRPDTFVRIAYKDLCYGHEGHTELIDLGGGYQCRGYSNGILGGKININRPMGGSRTRNGVGLTARGHLIIAQSTVSRTERAFCQAVNDYVLALGQTVRAFVLEDGGGSTAAYSARSRFWVAPEGGRPVPTVICAYLRQTPVITRPIYNGIKGEDARLIQTLMLTEVDGSFGPGSASRLKTMQATFGFPAALRCGILSAYTAQKMRLDFQLK